MKKFMKWCAVIALILLLIGLAMAFIAGSQLNLNPEDNFGVTNGENSWFNWMNSKPLYDIDDEVIFEDGYEVFTGDVEKYAVGSGVDSMDIKAGGCAFYCKASDDGNFYVEAEGAGKFQCYILDDVLYVKTFHAATDWKHNNDSEIVLYVPKGYSFEKVDVNLGAGLLELADVAATEMNLEVGAGQILAERIQMHKCGIEVGMGEIILEEIEADTVDAEVGMGHLEVDGAVYGDINASCAMGAIELKLTGTAEEFNYTVEAAMGNVTIDGASYTGLAQDKIIGNHAGKNMNVECSMGDIQVEFTS